MWADLAAISDQIGAYDAAFKSRLMIAPVRQDYRAGPSFAPQCRQCASAAPTSRLHAGQTGFGFGGGRYHEMIQPIGPSAAPRTVSRTTAFLRLPINAPTAAPTTVNATAQNHSIGS